MTSRSTAVLVSLIALQAGVSARAAVLPATEAPTGFDTPTLIANPGGKSTSNGLVEPPGDTYVVDQQFYETQHDVNTGLGPVFNARACVECHQNPVSGGASQFTEMRIGHRDPTTGTFVNPTVPINDGAASISGRSIVNDRAVVPEAQEHVPDAEDVRALRATLNTLGDGFVEAIDDSTLMAIAAKQPRQSFGLVHGEPIEVPMFEAPGLTRVGRFGWKDQHSSLLSFVADAYLNEMGVTSRLRPTDTTSIGKVTKDPEDVPDAIGLADIDHFTQFIRGTKAPPRDATLAASAAAVAGERIFNAIGCSVCHVDKIVTAPAGTLIDGGTFTVPVALGNKIIHPYGDFLMHDIGTGDGIAVAVVEHYGRRFAKAETMVSYKDFTPEVFQITRNRVRTAPLWGVRMRPRLMHDGASLTLSDAIARHRGEAEQVRSRFQQLPSRDREAVLEFLKSL